jgi:8-oxo-dGTP pyrophosphatase MutT (NUDIX family)
MRRYVDIIFFDKDDQILLLRRSPDAEYMPNRLCLPGGHVESGSSLHENAYRELEEETGIIAHILTKAENWTFSNGEACTTIFVCFEYIEANGKIYRNAIIDRIPRITFSEHSDYMFVSVAQLFSPEVSDQLMPEMINYLSSIFH